MRAVDDDPQAVERELASGTSPCSRRRSGRARPRSCGCSRRPPARRAGSSSSGDAISASISASTSSGSLKPSRAKILMPLSSNGLCEARITTPASQRIDEVMKAMPGRRQRAGQPDVGAHRDDAGGERGLEHVARQPGVLADHDAGVAAGLPEPRGDRHAEAHHGARWSSARGSRRRACRRCRTAYDRCSSARSSTHGARATIRRFTAPRRAAHARQRTRSRRACTRREMRTPTTGRQALDRSTSASRATVSPARRP